MHKIEISSFNLEILRKVDNNTDYFTNYVHGKVKLNNSYIYKNVYMYDEETNCFVESSTTISGTDFIIKCNTQNPCFLVCISDNISYNNLIAANVHPKQLL